VEGAANEAAEEALEHVHLPPGDTAMLAFVCRGGGAKAERELTADTTTPVTRSGTWR
jgi:hypothetical protein